MFPSLSRSTPSLVVPSSALTLNCTCGVLVHSFPGFCRLRMHSKGGSPVTFVEYQDVRYAAQVMAALQGSFLLSSDRGAIRIEYAKTKMAAEVGPFCLCSLTLVVLLTFFIIKSVHFCFATLTHLSVWFLYCVGYLSILFD